MYYFVNVEIHSKIKCPFLILIVIDPRLLRAQNKTMRGVEHDISEVCKMSKALIEGNLMGFGPKSKPIFFVMGS